MQDKIQKLYELAGVWSVGCYDCPLFIDDIICLGIVEEKTCPYPPFTDTKQLEMIKWLSKNFDIIRYWINDSEYIVEINGIFGNNKDFSQALAGLVCELWEDLTDELREEVRGILQ